MKNLSPTYKGVVTGAIMMLLSFGIYSAYGNFENPWQYVTYAVYVAGIVWTLREYKRSDAENKTFKSYFSQGFKCFIVVTFLMVLFTWVFLKTHPELKEAMAIQYRADLVKAGNKTPKEIDDLVSMAKQYSATMLVSMAIFGYLGIGTFVTFIVTALLRYKKAA